MKEDSIFNVIADMVIGDVRRLKRKMQARAHAKVRAAIKRGEMTRGCCEVCEEPKAHAHHPNYHKPLEVIWLCHAHHMCVHSILRKREPAIIELEEYDPTEEAHPSAPKETHVEVDEYSQAFPEYA